MKSSKQTSRGAQQYVSSTLILKAVKNRRGVLLHHAVFRKISMQPVSRIEADSMGPSMEIGS